MHDVDKLPQLCLHGREGDVLRRPAPNPISAGVLLREEALGNDDVEVDARAQPCRCVISRVRGWWRSTSVSVRP